MKPLQPASPSQLSSLFSAGKTSGYKRVPSTTLPTTAISVPTRHGHTLHACPPAHTVQFTMKYEGSHPRPDMQFRGPHNMGCSQAWEVPPNTLHLWDREVHICSSHQRNSSAGDLVH
ncbi:hypothetical protein DPEC_G00314070 [Dallia pectoralis]|uniref:Uncharacterized protein n=1 Tax=Dallia pectoralis TaxID=75939 RepID=A0ACC2FC38_DALPE|nr:hypothetical protein DPEC_G00314070 [Dallia pectoralis]